MRVLHYGNEQDFLIISEIMDGCPSITDGWKKYDRCDDYEEFVLALTSKQHNVVIVTMNNAIGMEGVIAAKTQCPDIPVVWFSNDKGFGLQSYRLGCAYFGAQPINVDNLGRAIERCRLQLRIS